MKRAVNPQTGEVLVWDEFAKQWRAETGAQQAARETGPLQAGVVATGAELSDWGRTIAKLWGGGAPDEGAARAMGALGEEFPAATMAGAALPTLATGGLGLTGAAGRGAVGMLLEQSAIGALTGGLSSPEDVLAGIMGGGALGAGGYLGGQMSARVAAGIWRAGAAARASRMASAAAGASAEGAGRAGGELGADMPLGRAARGLGVAEGIPEDANLGAAGATGAGHAELMGEARRLGMWVPPGVERQSNTLRQIEAGLQSSPWSSGAYEELQKGNRTIINELTARALGQEGAPNLAPVGLAGVADRLAKVFNRTGKMAGMVDVETPLIASNLDTIEARASAGSTKAPKVVAMIGGLRELANEDGRIAGSRLMEERARLVQRQKQFDKQGFHVEADGVGDIIETVDLALEKALEGRGALAAGEGQARMQAYNEARAQWRVLRNVERNAVDQAGNVLPGALFQNLRQDYGATLSRGLVKLRMGDKIGDLVSALRVANYSRDIVGDSGTATRMAMQGLSLGELGAGVVKRLTVQPLAKDYLKGGTFGAGLLGGAQGAAGATAAGRGAGFSGAVLSRAIGGLL